MLAIDIGPMIDRGLDDNCGTLLGYHIDPETLPSIGRELLPELSPRSFKGSSRVSMVKWPPTLFDLNLNFMKKI